MFLIDGRYWLVKDTRTKGQGVFAKKAIRKGVIIGDYLGEIVSNAEYDISRDAQGLYLMYLTDSLSIYPDFKQPGIYLMNHSCVPNCGMYVYEGHTIFFTIRNIKPGEELTISYMLSPNICRDCTHQCRCGLPSCSGTMHLSKEKYALWQKYQKNLRKMSKAARFRAGQNLERLLKYPARIIVDQIYESMFG